MGERAATIVGLAGVLLGCSSSSAPADGGSLDGTHAEDARFDAGVGAHHDAGNACAQDGGPVTVTVVPMAHLTASTPFVDIETTLPEGCWSSVKVTMTASSDCTGAPPPGQNWPTNCDPYDRLAQLTLADTGKTPMFVLDAVTSFGGSATWTEDVTDYVSLLTGKHTYHLEIDTYDDPGQTGTASSHDATVTIVLTPGTPPHEVLLAVPLLRADITAAPDAGTTDAGNSPPLSAMVTAPAGATSARFDYFTSGHGGNGPDACDEFCPKVNVVSLDGTSVYSKAPTKSCTDNCTHVPLDAGSISCGGDTYDYYCEQNPEACPPSPTFTRSNWCPSQIITPIPIPLPASALTGEHSVGLTIVGIDGTWSTGLSAVFYR
jgi:hypothetical protein